MGRKLSLRLTEELLDWVKATSRRTGIPMARVIRERLEEVKATEGQQTFMRHVGVISGAPDLSSRKGYSRQSSR